MVCAAQPHCRLDDCFEYGLELGWRATDDVQHVGGRRLVLKGLLELERAVLYLIEKAHVLNRDHRLVRKGGDELDLLIGERLYARTRKEDRADRAALA